MLKKSLFSLALISIFGSQIFAQTLSVGPTVGLNIATIKSSPITEPLLGYNAGGFANYSINEHFGLSAKLIYSQLGANYTEVEDIIRLHYVQVPLSAVYYFGDNGSKVRPKIFAGPYVGALLKAKNKVGDEIQGTDKKSAYTPIDFGGQVGLGINYLVKSRTWLNVDTAFGRSFNDIFKSSINNYHNLNLSVNLGLSFPVGDN